MSLSSGHWYPVLSSRELGKTPVGKMRFGERVVFWRDAAGAAVMMHDRCPHRGAALSLGRVCDGTIECPFHGFRYGGDGRCVRVPVEKPDWEIPARLRVEPWTTREAAGYVWAWRGPAADTDALPELPRQPVVEGLEFGETRSTWHAHYTRCIENVIDYSHLPFVHRTSIGAGIRDPVTEVVVEPFEGGFNFLKADARHARQFVEFVYPNLWANRVGSRYVLTATFVPVDERRTEVYSRWYHSYPKPLRPLVDLFGLFSQFIVFRDDLPIVASQAPGNVDDADADRLVPSDGGLVAYRRLRRMHQDELGETGSIPTA